MAAADMVDLIAKRLGLGPESVANSLARRIEPARHVGLERMQLIPRARSLDLRQAPRKSVENSVLRQVNSIAALELEGHALSKDTDLGDCTRIDRHAIGRCARTASGRLLDGGQCDDAGDGCPMTSRRSSIGRRRRQARHGRGARTRYARRLAAGKNVAAGDRPPVTAPILVGVADNYAGLIDEVRQVNRRNAGTGAGAQSRRGEARAISAVPPSVRGKTSTAFLQMLGSLCIAISGRAAPAAIAAADVADLPALPRRLAGDPDRGADHLPDRRHHRAAGHSSISASSAPTPTSSTWSAFWCCANSAC